MSPIIEMTRQELTDRRNQILRELGTTLDDYRELAERGEFSGAEWLVRDELDEIAFLLGEDTFVD